MAALQVPPRASGSHVRPRFPATSVLGSLRWLILEHPTPSLGCYFLIPAPGRQPTPGARTWQPHQNCLERLVLSEFFGKSWGGLSLDQLESRPAFEPITEARPGRNADWLSPGHVTPHLLALSWAVSQLLGLGVGKGLVLQRVIKAESSGECSSCLLQR